jgi:hypothetical protein
MPALSRLTMLDAWVPDQSPGGYRVVPGIARDNGTFLIPDVPDGAPYMLHFLNEANVPTFYATDQHDIDVLYERGSRCAPTPTYASSAMPVTFSFTGMTPYSNGFAIGDSVDIDSFAIKYQGTQFWRDVADGATELTGVHNWDETNFARFGVALPNASKGNRSTCCTTGSRARSRPALTKSPR